MLILFLNFIKKIQSVLDIGSNDGFLLKSSKEKVPYILGIDVRMARLANKDKIKTIHDYFNLNHQREYLKIIKKNLI